MPYNDDTRYTVVDEWDGCWMADLFTGSKESCKDWMRKNWAARNRGKSSLGLRNNDSGRMESFIL